MKAEINLEELDALLAGADVAAIMAVAYVHAIACEGHHTDPGACQRRMNTVIARLHDAGFVIAPIEPTPGDLQCGMTK